MNHINAMRLLPRGVIDLTGQQYGRLRVLGFLRLDKVARWACVCDCGNLIEARSNALRIGNTKSCGCLRSENTLKALIKHGLSRTPTQRSWMGIKQRCLNPKNPDFHGYGGRGITMCESWMSFSSFLSDMGECPTGMSIDRIDNEKGYYKENCKWATQTEQVRNRRKTLLWGGRPLAEWAEKTGEKYMTLFYRLKKHGTPFYGKETPCLN
jgi:hypothetical protein